MKSLVKSFLLVLAGAFFAAGLLYGYSIFFKTAGQDFQDEALRFVPIEPGDAVISRISGEVYIIREEQMIAPKPGDSVREGDVIKVVDDSWCQVHFIGKATMNLRSNTLIKIQKLLSSPQDSDIRTELLTGSMIYKVDKLDATDNLEVTAQEKIYRVEGTEFIVEAYSGGSRVAVREGSVAVLQSGASQDEELLKTVPSGFTLDLMEWNKEKPLPEIEELSQEEIRIFEEEGPSDLLLQKESLVYLEIRTEPSGAQLYLDGRLTGQGTLKGLFPSEGTLRLLARKRGFRDNNLNIKLEDLTSSVLTMKLEVLGITESLEEESKNPPQETLEQIKAKFEKESADLKSGFSRKIEENEQKLQNLNSLSMGLQSDILELRNKNTSLERQKEELAEELEESLSESEKLRALLIQIQELSDQ
ncbi:hypothetical protein EXM22_11530 [Oceanispirochaeta crateris]|uniref:FecR protein domain-containing protein n=1 Tax=Oceanispirochaeta crateris TaxID=2518645 RepID=A0A5C1QPR7_9SPIO|nr:FecR family protein [Oceanispirochaeta crateris]QEN08584.1 hypothetical protein EXM22_11530 [Oceanispirochaeta crateris]